MADPISFDDMADAVAPAAPAAPVQAAPAGPVSFDDMDTAVQTEPKAQPSAPQFDSVWRKPALFATNMVQGLADAVPATAEYLFGPNPNSHVTMGDMDQGLANEVMLRAQQDETAGQPKRPIQSYLDDINKDEQANAYRTTKAVNAGLAATGVANRPDLQPQDAPERFIAAAGQGAGAALPAVATGGANLPAAGLNLARGVMGGIGAEAGHELFPNSEVAPLIGGLAGGATVEAPRAALSTGAALVKPFTASGQGSAVDDLIRGAAVNPASLDNLPNPPLPGMDLTLGQLSNDPGIQALERGIQGNTPASQGAVNARVTTNNGIIRNAIGSLHSDGAISNPVDAMADASVRMRDALDTNLAQGRAQEKTMWSGITADAPTDSLKSDVNAYATGQPVSVDGNDLKLTKARQQFIPQNLVSSVNNLSDTEPLNELTDLRSVISTAQREAYNAGEWNKANVIGGLDKIVLNRINNLDVPPEQLDQYTAARDFSAQLNQKYSQGPVAKVLGNDSTGADRVPPTATGGQFFKSGPGGLEALQSFATAAGDNPDAVQAAKDYAVARMMKDGSTRGLDLNNQPKIDFGNLNTYLNNNQHVMESGLFSPDELNQIEAIHQAADMSGRTARSQLPYGSPTAEKIKSGQYVQAPISPLVPKALGIIGGAVGGFHVGGPVGGIVGGLEGGSVANKLYSGPNAKIAEALQQRLLHPTAQPTSP